MADLNRRVETFITMLLDVSGRARPADLEAHDRIGAEELLHQYAEAHPERYLAFDGGALVVSAAPEPVPEPVFEPIVEPEPIPEEVPAEPFVFDAAAIPEVNPMPAQFELEPEPVLPDLSAIPMVVPLDAEPVAAEIATSEPPAATPTLPYEDEAFFEFGPSAAEGISVQTEPELVITPEPIGAGDLEFAPVPEPELVITPEPIGAGDLDFVPVPELVITPEPMMDDATDFPSASASELLITPLPIPEDDLDFGTVAAPAPIVIPEEGLSDEGFGAPEIEIPAVEPPEIILGDLTDESGTDSF